MMAPAKENSTGKHELGYGRRTGKYVLLEKKDECTIYFG